MDLLLLDSVNSKEFMRFAETVRSQKKMNDKRGNAKPTLGVKPYWVAAWSRIGELASAIERQYESPKPNTKLVEKWANEITWQCTIIEALRGDDDA